MKATSSLRLLALAVTATLLFAVCPGRTEAAFVFRLTQAGGNVVVNGSGTLNTTALTLMNSNHFGAGSVLLPNAPILAVDPASVNVEEYGGVTGPGPFGSGGPTMPGSSSGDAVVASGANVLFVPLNYVSGTALSDTMTFTGATFTSLGFTPGTYVFTWGTGTVNADSLTVTNVVPEPSTWALLLAGALGAFHLLKVRRGKAA